MPGARTPVEQGRMNESRELQQRLQSYYEHCLHENVAPLRAFTTAGNLSSSVLLDSKQQVNPHSSIARREDFVSRLLVDSLLNSEDDLPQCLGGQDPERMKLLSFDACLSEDLHPVHLRESFFREYF